MARPSGPNGFSLGAYWALWLVEQKPNEISGTVDFYGTQDGIYLETQSAFLEHFAETDEYVSASGDKKLEKTLRAAKKEVTFYTYPGTGHWFFESDRSVYNAQATDLAWDRTLNFLQEYMQ